MNRIRLLPEQVANQIAAGEVIERPASVVKELVENSLDAGAGRVTVECQAGGRGLVRVSDDGSGMSRDDALLCLERHATSKIRRAEDLFHIGTMGFRGEALPSIGSVSRFTLTTREPDAIEGTQIIVNGGKIAEVRSAGAPAGSTIEVRQLFFNLPARRKFLRSEETERAHITHYLTLAALAHPRVAFTLTHDGRTTLQLPATAGEDELANLRERLRALLGADLQLLPLDERGHYEGPVRNPEDDSLRGETEVKTIRVWGFIGAPGVSRSTRADQNLFVNRRPVENRGLNAALMEGYHTALMKGRFPVCCLFVELDPAEVDVNIHPAKREIKFHRERQVRQFVTQAVRLTLLNYHGETGFAHVPATAAPATSGSSPAAAPPSAPALLPEWETPAWPARGPTAAQNPLPLGFRPGGNTAENTVRTAEPVRSEATAAGPPTPFQAVPLLAVPLRLVGVIGRLYVVLESDRGMVLMDQHAAHERILFEQMLERMEHGDAASQRLLLPETIELTARDTDFLKRHLATLRRLGVELSEFGERTFLLEALPPFVKCGNARQFGAELVDALRRAGDSVNSMRLGEDVVAKTVCRHAVKANDALATPELENLVNDLRRCRMPYTCPHGRPTLIEFSLSELERKFGRAV